MSANVIDAAHLEHQRQWSEATFGPGSRLDGVLDHVRKELDEIREAPQDATEWADGIILLFDGAWRNGIGAQQILDAIVAKQAKNERRKWPDWRTADPDKAIEHERVCEGFRWLGQSFRHCDECGEPYWEHDYDTRLKAGSGPFDDEPFDYVPISQEAKDGARARWDR